MQLALYRSVLTASCVLNDCFGAAKTIELRGEKKLPTLFTGKMFSATIQRSKMNHVGAL